MLIVTQYFQDDVCSYHLDADAAEGKAGGSGHARGLEPHHHADRDVLLHRPQPGGVHLPQGGETPLPPQVWPYQYVRGRSLTRYSCLA